MISSTIFWFSFAVLVYVYVGFMCLLILIALFKRRPQESQERLDYPSVSIIICAYNEEKTILRKIENSLAFDYPHERLEILIVSDGSTDTTNDILRSYPHPLIRVLFMSERVGKSACQNRAAQEARNEILFFTDATAMHPPDALRILVQGFADSQIGCVTGRPVFRRDTNITCSGLSKREHYELLLRRNLSELSTLFGAQDCMYAIPRKLFIPTRPDLDSGFVGPLQLLARGYKTKYVFDALAFIERRPPNLSDEFARRSRIVLHGLRGLIYMRGLMNPLRYGFTAISLVSSRLLRWLSPVLLLMLFASNLFLLHRGSFYVVMLFIQVLFYGAAWIGYRREKKGRTAGVLFSVPFYFCMLMCAAVTAIVRLCRGETYQTWQTSR